MKKNNVRVYYRITKEQDKFVKKQKVGEAEFIRQVLECFVNGTFKLPLKK